MIQLLVDKLKQAGVEEEGLKRKDWPKARDTWFKLWPENCGMAQHRMMFDRLTTALARTPITWSVPGDPEVFAYMRKMAIAAGE